MTKIRMNSTGRRSLRFTVRATISFSSGCLTSHIWLTFLLMRVHSAYYREKEGTGTRSLGRSVGSQSLLKAPGPAVRKRSPKPLCTSPLPLTFSLCCALFGGSPGSLCFRFGGVGCAPLPLALGRCRALFWGGCCQPLPRPFSLCRAQFGGLISKHDSYPGRPSA